MLNVKRRTLRLGYNCVFYSYKADVWKEDNIFIILESRKRLEDGSLWNRSRLRMGGWQLELFHNDETLSHVVGSTNCLFPGKSVPARGVQRNLVSAWRLPLMTTKVFGL